MKTTTTISFSKYSGNGNDFLILDRPRQLPSQEAIQRLCNRHFGVGADGVLTLTEAPPGLDGEMRIFNADGSEAEMCGNGLRCLVTYMDEHTSVKKNAYRIKTMNAIYTVNKLATGAFAIEMSELKDQNLYDLSTFLGFIKSFFINTGVPHLVFLSFDIKNIDIKQMAPQYRYHSMFNGGTNVNLVETIDSKKQIAYIRTYERGVEDETFSCGTGLVASAMALSHWFGWKGDITLMTLGGKQIVHIGDKVLYSGEVVHCFSGEMKL